MSNWCVKCMALETEPAGEDCGNPIWHTPPAATKPSEYTGYEVSPEEDDED